MKTILNKLKNAYKFAYYECYLQEHYFVQKHENKNFNANATLGAVLGFLLYFPLLIFINKTIGIQKFMYVFIIIFAYFQLFFTSWIVKDTGDLTQRINTFYTNSKIIKESKKIVLGFVLLCIAIWVFVIMYPIE